MVIPLHGLKPGEVAHIVELRSNDPARLDRLCALGLVPGSRIVLQQVAPALVFRVGETEVSIDLAVADEILVRTG